MGSVWQLLLLIMLTGVLPLPVIADEPIFPRARGERCGTGWHDAQGAL